MTAQCFFAEAEPLADFGDPGLIFGYLREDAIGGEVGAAVADCTDLQFAVGLQSSSEQRCSHAFQLPVRFGGLADGAVYPEEAGF